MGSAGNADIVIVAMGQEAGALTTKLLLRCGMASKHEMHTSGTKVTLTRR
jgi:hypothetical protein